MNLSYRWILAFFFASSFSSSFSQDQFVADSLKEVFVEQKLKGEDQLSILFLIVSNETDPIELEDYSDLLISAAKESKELVYAYRGYLKKGYAKQLQGYYDLAFQSFFVGLDYALKAKYKPGIGASYTAIADAYSLSGDSRNSRSYYRKGIEVLRAIPDSVTLAVTLLNAGDEYLNSNQLDSALILFEESRVLFNLLDYEIGQAYNIGNVGLVYARQGKYEQAEENLNKASDMLEQLGDIYPISEYNFSMADIYLEQGQIKQAISHALFGYNIATYYNLKKEMKDGAERLSQLYEQRGDLRKSLNFLRESVALSDSLNTTEVVREMAELRREFEVAQKQAEVDLLDEQRRTQQVISRAMILFLILTGIVIFILYKTNKKRLKLNKELAVINETKTKFFSIISHDLRSPISAFYGINRVIKHLIQKKRYDDLEKMTEEIDRSVRSISGLLDNLLKWAVQQQGEFRYEPEKLQLHEVVEENCSLLQPVADAKKISVSVEIAEDQLIWADKNSILTVFRNILSNAIKFTPEGGNVHISAELADDHICVNIEDTGIGIPKDELDKLFEFHAKKSTYGTSGEKGIGLGIQLAHEFTLLNQGKISFESTEGKGTKVQISLPVTEHSTSSL